MIGHGRGQPDSARSKRKGACLEGRCYGQSASDRRPGRHVETPQAGRLASKAPDSAGGGEQRTALAGMLTPPAPCVGHIQSQSGEPGKATRQNAVRLGVSNLDREAWLGPNLDQKLRSTRGQSDLGCALDVAFALLIAQHHITKNDVLAVARLLLGHDTATGQGRIVGHRRPKVGGELFQRASGKKFGEHAR